MQTHSAFFSSVQEQYTSDGSFDVERIREDFPALHQVINGKPLVYLDNASTTQKPRVMIERIQEVYSREFAKTRTNHALGKHITEAYEATRAALAAFIHAADPKEIIFLRGATEAINVVANGFARDILNPGDEVLLTQMEHHSNIVPWQFACRQRNATIKVAPINKAGDLDLNRLEAMLSPRTKVVAITHVSNVLGTIYPVKQVVELAHARGIPVLIDGAQSAPHLPVDVQEIGCDFYCASGHKMFGPTGVGFLYGRTEWLERLSPQEGGSPMAESVTFEKSSYKPLPQKFEAGVPAIAETLGFGASLEYLNTIGMDKIAAYEEELVQYAGKRLDALDGVQVVGTSSNKVSVLSFAVDGVEPQKVDSFLDSKAGIAVRSGKLSAQPLIQFLGLPAVVRASFGFYNTHAEADTLVDAVAQCVAVNR